LRAIPVDREGEFIYTLRPQTNKYPNRLLCEITVIDNAKVITVRSTYKIENLTLYPLEVMLLDDQGQPIQSVQRIIPGNYFAIPIESVTTSRVRVQPDRELIEIYSVKSVQM
jgi:vacuolar protein sorting-associated protein 13A/C